jgi:hypothetical protein
VFGFQLAAVVQSPPAEREAHVYETARADEAPIVNMAATMVATMLPRSRRADDDRLMMDSP